ncbi:MAG: M3 family oligoendopeptidase, partial [Planctomycetota bacterium]
PEDCLSFHKSVERRILPVVKEMQRKRKKELKIDALRPWDLMVDSEGKEPLRPFKTIEELVQGCQTIFQRLDPELSGYFEEMHHLGLLDLENRKNKAPGGFQHALEESKYPFIFMNAVGLHRDMEVLLHESGHAFNYYLSCFDPIVMYRHPPIEFAEVASMSMELLGSQHWNVFYSEEDALRARKQALEGILDFFPWCCTIDAFQHEIYTRPTLDIQERENIWQEVFLRFNGEVDWTGLEPYQAALWQKQLHLFECPFYYIEYGLAQMGALQIWLAAKENSKEALQKYKKALSLGGRKKLRELYQAAGIELVFEEDKIAYIVDRLMEEYNFICEQLKS